MIDVLYRTKSLTSVNLDWSESIEGMKSLYVKIEIEIKQIAGSNSVPDKR
jgi:hypothetical protein